MDFISLGVVLLLAGFATGFGVWLSREKAPIAEEHSARNLDALTVDERVELGEVRERCHVDVAYALGAGESEVSE